MDKQEKEELVNQLNSRLMNYPSDSWVRGHNEGLKSAVIVVSNLPTADEPKKVKVPAFVEEHIEYSDSANWTLLESIQEMNGNVGSRELANWFEAHSEDYARAWLDGYEVEEEPKWIVCYSTMYLKSPLETGQIESVEITPKKELAYHFKSYKEAKQQTSLIGGAVGEVEV